MKSWIKGVFAAVNVRSILAIVLAAVVVLVTTACNANPPAPNVSGTGSYYNKKGQNTELYDTIQPRKDGMNNYSDTDPRFKR
jgi:hypothetical protein